MTAFRCVAAVGLVLSVANSAVPVLNPWNSLSFDEVTYEVFGGNTAHCYVNTALRECFPRPMISKEGRRVYITAWVHTCGHVCEDRTQKVCVPSRIQQIGLGAFENCSRLTWVAFEAGSALKKIEEDAFACSLLASICLPRSIEKIKEDAFSECHSLQTVFFDKGSQLSCIGPRAFEGCALQAIYIPSDVESIWRCAFSKCQALNFVTFEPGSKLQVTGIKVFAGCLS
ncbi:MAG: leucine-rich repeat domain-containing protein, partial [Holosporales bacterium]|nr:leucine-rich repeat domain-containing protein [Holosporales bacterium]